MHRKITLQFPYTKKMYILFLNVCHGKTSEIRKQHKHFRNTVKITFNHSIYDWFLPYLSWIKILPEQYKHKKMLKSVMYKKLIHGILIRLKFIYYRTKKVNRNWFQHSKNVYIENYTGIKTWFMRRY